MNSTAGTTDDDAETLRRLQWQCRRGMLELDDLLLRFLELGYQDLDPAGRETFRTLLGQQDQDLSDWLMARRESDHADFADLVTRIRSVASAQRATDA